MLGEQVGLVEGALELYLVGKRLGVELVGTDEGSLVDVGVKEGSNEI
jgi:hypothetical protein